MSLQLCGQENGGMKNSDRGLQSTVVNKEPSASGYHRVQEWNGSPGLFFNHELDSGFDGVQVEVE